jgi:HKD family nuclease
MPTRGPTIDLIDNRGPNTLLATLRRLLAARSCSFVEIQVAFVSAAGVGNLLPSLRRAASRIPIRIVTGLYQGVTEPAALRLLLKAQQQTKGRLQTRLAKDLNFHRKLYVVGTADVRYAVSGSSNLTAEGLTSRGEFNLLARVRAAGQEARSLQAHFDTLWSKGTVPLSADRIRRYAAARPRRPRTMIAKRSLRGVLGYDRRATDGSDASFLSRAPRHWRDYVSGYADPTTETMVSAETDWDRRRYDWYASQTDSFHPGDRILLFDGPNRSAQLTVVKDTTSMPRLTPDGRHFVAFVPSRGCRRRRFGRNLWKAFTSVGLPLSAAARTKRRQLSEGQWARIETVFEK